MEDTHPIGSGVLLKVATEWDLPIVDWGRGFIDQKWQRIAHPELTKGTGIWGVLVCLTAWLWWWLFWLGNFSGLWGQNCPLWLTHHKGLFMSCKLFKNSLSIKKKSDPLILPGPGKCRVNQLQNHLMCQVSATSGLLLWFLSKISKHSGESTIFIYLAKTSICYCFS